MAFIASIELLAFVELSSPVAFVGFLGSIASLEFERPTPVCPNSVNVA